jgi:Uma2 family endonuclease
MVASIVTHTVTWEKLPEDYVLDDEPVDNINQPPIAAALTESLELAGRLPSNALTMANYGICATLNGQMVVKAPDWGYVPAIQVPRDEVKRSYTPQLQGDFPVIVVEILSDTDGAEYSSKPTYPPGKWFFYEQILRVPHYAIFEPDSGLLEMYRLDDSGHYQLQSSDENERYWIAEMNLFLGIWRGTRENRTGYWLRWWDQQANLLLWGAELAQQERQAKEIAQQEAEQEHQRAEQERQRAERLAERLRSMGVDVEGD